MSVAVVISIISLFSAVIGGVIAAVPVLIQSRRQERREALRLAADAALKDYESRAQKDVPSSSPIIFVWYYIRLMQLIEKNKLTREAIKQALREKDDLNAAFAEMAVERASRREGGA
jgi:hypothetical protein